MQTEAIKIEWAGPSKRFPDKYASVKGGNGIWYDAPIGILDRLKASKGQTVALVVEQTPKGFWQIRGFGPTQPQQIGQVLGAAPQAADHITQVEGMWLMAILGKAFEGTANVPDRRAMTDLIVNTVMAWRDAEDDLARIAEQNEQGDLRDEPPPPLGTDRVPF